MPLIFYVDLFKSFTAQVNYYNANDRQMPEHVYIMSAPCKPYSSGNANDRVDQQMPEHVYIMTCNANDRQMPEHVYIMSAPYKPYSSVKLLNCK